MSSQKNITSPFQGDRLDERLRAQTRFLNKIAGEYWNEVTGNKVKEFARECNAGASEAKCEGSTIRGQWPKPPSLWEAED